MITTRVNGTYVNPRKLYARNSGEWSKAKNVYARNAGTWALVYKWGEWYNSYAFTYLEGASVNVTITPSWTIPNNTYIELYAGEALDKMSAVTPGVPSSVIFTETASGSANIYIKAELYSTDGVNFPSIASLDILIQQETSLFTVATQVLIDGLADSGSKYYIDPQLQSIAIPYSWFAPISHRAALQKISEACGGSVYQDREGRIVVESALMQNGETIIDTINQDRIFDANTPVSNVINSIQLTTKPYIQLASQTVWELTGDNVINNSEYRTFEVFFSDYDAVMDAAAVISSTPSGATISSETWYTWGGRVTVLGSSNDQVLTLSVTGKPLTVRGSRIITEDDSASIRRNGRRTITIKDNQLMQDPLIAERIAESILSYTAQERRDIEIQWRGDPTLELGDRVTLDGQDGTIVGQGIKYNGALSSSMKVRRQNG